ncbi:MAG: ABC transporter permease, partial [Candidatus Bathyarchaeia archaeon]|nr:ABC transporter permease [Candidatus Bathyarchaeia archaeon]
MLKAAAEEESIIEVSFKKAPPKILEWLSEKLPELKVVAVDHNKVRIYGGDPTDAFERVLRFAKNEGVKIDKVNSIKPSLEDTFIKITGLSPIIMAIEKGAENRNVADDLRGIFYIALKDMRTYYLKPPSVSWGIVFPFAWILAFYLRNPQNFEQLVPGLIAMTILFSTTAAEAVVINFELRLGSLGRLLLTPISLPAVLLGKVV